MDNDNKDDDDDDNDHTTNIKGLISNVQEYFV